MSTTDTKMTKNAKIGGRNITAIDPQYQRKLATEQFGPFGLGWGVNGENQQTETFDDGTVVLFYNATLWYKWNGERGEFPIESAIKLAYMTRGSNAYLKVDEEATKKVATNALTKGLSKLGFNADVFMGKFDDNSYVEQQRELEAINADRATLSAEQILAVNTLLEKSKADVEAFLKYVKYESVEAIPKFKFVQVVSSLKAKIKKNEAAGKEKVSV